MALPTTWLEAVEAYEAAVDALYDAYEQELPAPIIQARENRRTALLYIMGELRKTN